ncbi:hypothetical protein [Amycolatopsis sp. NPDC004079]|uniref:hypothetical protein n=1 Tax=Amycolatopsis sp. NPDC004079 TaxID=3154549 RepID=UPI0033A32AF7
MADAFPYRLGQAVAAVVADTRKAELFNATVVDIGPRDPDGGRMVRVRLVGPDRRQQSYYVRGDASAAHLSPCVLRPTLDDDGLVTDERYAASCDGTGDAPWVLRFEGEIIAETATEAECWWEGIIHSQR